MWKRMDEEQNREGWLREGEEKESDSNKWRYVEVKRRGRDERERKKGVCVNHGCWLMDGSRFWKATAAPLFLEKVPQGKVAVCGSSISHPHTISDRHRQNVRRSKAPRQTVNESTCVSVINVVPIRVIKIKTQRFFFVLTLISLVNICIRECVSCAARSCVCFQSVHYRVKHHSPPCGGCQPIAGNVWSAVFTV